VVSVAGILLLAGGGVITLVGRHQLGSYGTGTITIEDQHQLITTGLYARIRHPIYLGGLVGSLGAGLAFRSALVTVLSLIIFFLVFRHRMEAEEKLLEKEFGQDYVLYKKRTNRLIPGLY
jgi:protein-S-isoprenylcysteine O-methyltransferase Ste14